MKTLATLLIVGSGGFFGSAARFAISGLVHRWIPSAMFPWGTLAVNIGGCFVIGLLFGLGETRQLFSPHARLFLLVGVLGGFTTFSTFGLESFNLLRDGEAARALANVALHIIVGLGAVWAGLLCSR
ncbi:MAG: fluoride efflux transporter CrcB [Rhodothermales bacterium]